jgi:hypothetical protein
MENMFGMVRGKVLGGTAVKIEGVDYRNNKHIKKCSGVF